MGAPLRVGLVTLFPELLRSFVGTGVVGRAQAAGLLSVHYEDLRQHGLGKHRSVDDTPYGGGAGMVLRVDCVVAAMEAAQTALAADVAATRVLLTPQGVPFDQGQAQRLSEMGSLLLVCGRYEGFDDRVRSHVDLEVSLGDFVLMGGEVAAMAVIEACARLLPGALGNASSTGVESFSDENAGGLEFPQFTRPAQFRGQGVPDVLLSGHHGDVLRWRQQQGRQRTLERRPDLLRPRKDES